MKKIIRILKEHSGASWLLGSFIAFGLLVISLICLEYAHLNVVSIGIRDAVQNATTAACTENYDKVYNGIREGYSGGYKLTNGSWSEDIDTGDVYSKLDSILGTRAEGNEHVKYDGSNVAYSISDLSVQMTNTPLAPGDPEQANKFTGIAYITLSVPMGFNWGVPPMQVRLKVIAGYIPKF